MAGNESSTAEQSEGLTISDDPLCRETALPSLDTWITPTDRFFVRSHFSTVPDLDATTFSLTLDGAVSDPFAASYDELKAMPSREVLATLECAGNSRSYVTPPAEGLQFRHGAVGNARWKGVSVAELLSKAGVKDTAKEVLFEGADFGEEEEEGETLHLGFERSLPLAKAIEPDTIVAYEMNGRPLELLHGYPCRLIVPGWYGMASVKWLRRIQVLEEPYDGFFQSRRYVHINEGETARQPWRPVTSVRVKSLITHPRHGEVVRPGHYTVRGMAWSGEGEIAKVEISVGGEGRWREAHLVGPSVDTAWRQWELSWTVSRPGHFIIEARSTDSAGNSQPESTPWNFRGYVNNGVHVIAVEVPPGKGGP